MEKIEVLFSLSWLEEPRVEIEEVSRKGKKIIIKSCFLPHVTMSTCSGSERTLWLLNGS